MTETPYDLALGIHADALNSGLTTLHSQHRAVFQGSYGPETIDEIDYTFAWDFLKPPELILSKPDAGLWSQMIKAQGITDLPDSGVLQLHALQLQVNGTIAGEALPQGVSEVKVAVQAKVDGGGITVVPLGVWLSEILDPYTRIMVDKVIVPNVLDQAKNLVNGLKLPVRDLFGQQVALTPVLLDVTGTHLVLTATAGTGQARAAGAATDAVTGWPSDKQVFLLVGRDLLARLLQGALDQWQDTQLADDDKTVPGIASVWWKAKFHKADNVKVDKSDPTTISADFDIPWSVGVDLFPVAPGKGCALFKASQES
ncbi:hypothetical protein [Kitasatospora kifunensis]|uniref:Uncharacterized protein n=1 Tax=Kitasatospora kifunensis TaxID=58351 RepID=A0A7W7R9R4_KITKI|nr:hypothetical protein [Kitasatospora kifunensis]MBB4928045.1 hypothetical protein [Kitasatospora kifunensis]